MSDITTHAVASSMLSEAGYDEKTRTLRAVFNNGAVFDYNDVPPREYQGLLAAESKGAYFATVIKTRACTRVSPRGA